MKRSIVILVVCLSLFAYSKAFSSLPSERNGGGLYADDSYYWPVVDTLVTSEPIYDRNAREFIFLEDTLQHPDTVRMQIVEK